MTTKNLREYAANIADMQLTHVKDARFAAALELIGRERVLDIKSNAVRDLGLTLEILIPALLEFSLTSRFIKFDPWDATIEVKQFPASYLAYQYNPYRDIRNRQATGQKTSAPAGAKPDFLAWESFPEAEHYLVWTAAAGRRYGVLVQPVPIVPGHLIIASLDYDQATNAHFPQVMTARHLADMHELQTLLEPLGYAMGYNDHQAGASVDHFHTQAVLKGFLPFLCAYENEVLAVRSAYITPQDILLKVLAHKTTTGVKFLNPNLGIYPAIGLVVEGVIGGALLGTKQVVLKQIQAAGWVYNSLGWRLPNGRQAEVIFPRTQEYILNHALKAGYVEMSGMLVIPERELYLSLQDVLPGENALREAGPTAEAFSRWLTELLKLLIKHP